MELLIKINIKTKYKTLCGSKTRVVAYLLVIAMISGLHCKAQLGKILHLAPYPQFSASKLCANDTAYFTNQTIGGATYKWILSLLDTTTSNIQRIDSTTNVDYQYYFLFQGVYLLTLEADNGHLSTLTKTISINNTTKASFDFMECPRQFVNMSTCADQFLWYFGDGDTTTNPIPTHQYADTGFYQMKLVAKKGAIKDSLVKTIHVERLGYADPTFTLSAMGNTVTLALIKPIGPNLNVNWNLGDGTDTGTSVVHVYPDSTAVYYISVIVTNACGIMFDDTTILLKPDVGIREYKSSGQIEVYPNPAQKIITLDLSKLTNVINYFEVINSNGIIKTKQFHSNENRIVLDVSQFDRGFYLVRFVSEKSQYIKKIIVE